MTDGEKWNAVIQCDKAYDDVFFYGVKTTGIFCRPSCKSKLPRQDHVLFFDRSEGALAAGFRPCKRCRPDLSEYMPMAEIVEQAKSVIDTCFADHEALTAKMSQLGISQNYLSGLFRRQLGLSPAEYRNKLRVEKSKELLYSTTIKVLPIALACGFTSLSAFYEIFKKLVGVTPREYRRNSKGAKE